MDRDVQREEASLVERRRERRVKFSVPVEISWQEPEKGGAFSRVQVQSVDLSPGGILCSFSNEGVFVPGDVLKISINIPQQLRHVVPFSRIAGASRVVRIAVQENGEQVALAFCNPGTERLGSIVHS